MSFQKNLISEAVSLLVNQKFKALYIPETIRGKGFLGQVRNFERSFYNQTPIDALRLVNKDLFLKVKGFDEKKIAFGPDDWDFTKMKIFVWDKFPNTKEPFLSGYQTIRPLPSIEQTLPFFQFFNAFGGVAWYVRRGETDHKFFQYNLAQLNLFFHR